MIMRFIRDRKHAWTTYWQIVKIILTWHLTAGHLDCFYCSPENCFCTWYWFCKVAAWWDYLLNSLLLLLLVRLKVAAAVLQLPAGRLKMVPWIKHMAMLKQKRERYWLPLLCYTHDRNFLLTLSIFQVPEKILKVMHICNQSYFEIHTWSTGPVLEHGWIKCFLVPFL